MPPRITRLTARQSRAVRLSAPPGKQQVCFICRLSRATSAATGRPRIRPSKELPIQARWQSTVSTESIADTIATPASKSSRIELRDALNDLQKQAGSFVNISRLQLALRGLEQEAGQETIRIAILGLADGGASLKKAKELLRLLVADPLKTEEEWERILVNDPPGTKPLLLKIGHNASEESIAGSRMVQELHTSSPLLNGHNLEILVLEMDPPLEDGGAEQFMESVLVPTMKIPTSNTGRYTSVTTPVHKSLIVSQGISGAAAVLNFPIDMERETVGTAVDLRVGEESEPLPFQVIDIGLGATALDSFRSSVDNAILYEQNWFASGVPKIVDWLKVGSSTTNEAMKPALHKLINSVIESASLAIETEEKRHLSAVLSSKITPKDIAKLRRALSHWAEDAHTELRDQLDIAFNGQRWRKLGWWKLFWRVDDVSMISSDILNQRFLTDSEKQLIFLAGKISESGILNEGANDSPKNWAYKPIEEQASENQLGQHAPPPQMPDLLEPLEDTVSVNVRQQSWPIHIPVARTFLSQETVPALQALAQKLMLQTLSTSSFVTALGCLMYVSSVTTTFYEAGAVAAVGIVWSLRRMQAKWETARKFWEGEVREEGRKAVRAVEGVVGEALTTSNSPVAPDAELIKAKELVERAENALKTCK